MSIKIQLTKGEATVISDEDADLARWSWRLCDSNRKRHGDHYTCYAKCWVNKEHAANSHYDYGQTKRLHRVIMERILSRTLARSEHIDHINGDGLDNRRENLRLVTNSQNSMNSRKPRAKKGSLYGTRSNYKGVSRYKKKNGELGGYYAFVVRDGICHYLRGCATEEEAAIAYDTKAKELHGEFASLNFPDG